MPPRELSPRERQIIVGIAAGLTHKVIGAELGISHKTVNAHSANIRRILRTRDRAELIRWYDTHMRPAPHCTTCTCGQHLETVRGSQPEGSRVAY